MLLGLAYMLLCVDFTDRWARVWRMQNEHFAEVCIAEHDRYGGGSIMVSVGISSQGKTDLHVIDNGTLTAERYVNEIWMFMFSLMQVL